MTKPQLMRVVVQNYRSLRQIDVHLRDITVLVGPNGSGKSNFLQVLRFVRNILKQDLDAAFQEEGNFVTTKTPATIHHFDDITIGLYFHLGKQDGFFEVSIGESEEYGIALKSEKCQLGQYAYSVDASKITSSNLPESRLIPGSPTRLALSGVAFIEELAPLQPVYDFLSSWMIYSFFPNTLRLPQKPVRGRPHLNEEGSNLSTVLQHFLGDEHNLWRQDLFNGLARMIPSLSTEDTIQVKPLGEYLITLLKHTDEREYLDLSAESDGTLRVLAILTALYQTPSLPLIGLEEPDLMVHPGVIGVLCDILLEASNRSQIILTTHSPDH